MLIDRILPTYDATVVCEEQVDASPEKTWRAIHEADLRDPLSAALFAIRELPARIARRLRGEQPREVDPVTFDELTARGRGWVSLAVNPGVELVVGSVGRFWRHDYGNRPIAPGQFQAFSEPGYAKLAVSLSLRFGLGGTVLRYEARTAATDAKARRAFLRYWRLVGPGAGLVMRRVLRKVKAEAERSPAALL